MKLEKNISNLKMIFARKNTNVLGSGDQSMRIANSKQTSKTVLWQQKMKQTTPNFSSQTF